MIDRWLSALLALAITALGSNAAAQGKTTGGARASTGEASRAAPPPPASEASAPGEDGTWHLLPLVLPAYQPETSVLLGGAAVLALEYPDGSARRESQLLLAGAASVRRQFSLLLQPELYLFAERIHLAGALSAARFPDRFFGLGNDTRDSDEEPYTPVYYELDLGIKLRLFSGAYLGPNLRVHHADLVRIEPGGLLASGSIPGSRGGTSLELGIAALWDTRDRTLYPRSGGQVRARFGSARARWGSDFDYDALRVDVRWYLTTWDRNVLALQALTELRAGTPPFYSTGRLGGPEMLRGYFEGRYRDRQYVATQAEHRAPIIGRLGGAVFLAAGQVAPRLGELRLTDVKLAAGGGLRFAPLAQVPVNVRLDLAYGDALEFYFGIGEAF
jgi:hypothetical protein